MARWITHAALRGLYLCDLEGLRHGEDRMGYDAM
jgi:hypothetical protein